MRLKMKQKALIGLIFMALSATGFAAYHHAGEYDSDNFLVVYPDKAGTKLDSCALCHTGGVKGSTTQGSCQWCHDTYGYNKQGDIQKTLNSYGAAYLVNGRNADAIRAIANEDSDLDSYSNAVEIAALRFPGDKADDPTKVPAPFMVFDRGQLDRLPQHTQFLLMNASKSDDHYSEYVGVAMEDLLEAAMMLPEATGIRVYSPDGFSQDFSLRPDSLLYHAIGTYPPATYYYSEVADMALNPAGWCIYPDPEDFPDLDLANGDSIENEDGLKLLVAAQRNGEYLTPGKLNLQNKLDGEGPFRVVPPQKIPGPPDQRSTNSSNSLPWPYSLTNDHNAGFSPRSATIVRVGPLPEGTTDIDLLESGWKYIDEGKIVVYGAIHPGPTIISKLDALIETLDSSGAKAFKNVLYKKLLVFEAYAAHKLAKCGKYKAALSILQKGILKHVDGCSANGGVVDKDDWVTNCELQKKIYWDLHELIVMFGIIV